MTGTTRRARRWLTGALLLVMAATGCTPEHAPDTATTAPASLGPGPPPPAAAVEAGVSQPKSDPLYPDFGNPDLDVISYRLALAWVPESRQLTGEATLRIRATTDVTELSLDFVDSY